MKKFISLILSVVMLVSLFSFAFGITASADEKDYGIENTGITYFVDSESGNDKNDGLSEKTAWKTLQNVNNTTFEAGSAILLKRGCVWTDTFLWPKGSGDEENINYISCYGDENEDLPYISSIYDDSLDGLPPTDACVTISTDQNYWEISNLSLYNGTNSTGTQSVVKFYNSSSTNRMKGNVLRGCIINGSNPSNWALATRSGLTGISVEGFIDSVLIEDNEVSNVKSLGIGVNGRRAGCDYKGNPNQTSGKGVVIRGNSLYNIGKDGIVTNNCLEPLVEYNVCGKAHSYATTSAHVAMWPFACYGALYQYNEAYDTKTIYDGQGFDCDYLCYYTTFQYNYSHDNIGGFMLICTEAEASWLSPSYAYNVGSTVRYNISQNDKHYIFNLCDAIEDTRIYNNTIYASRNSGTGSTHLFFSYDKGTNKLNGRNLPHNTLVANNIFYLDSMPNFNMEKNTETVVKNNLFCGKNFTTGPYNTQVTTKTDSSGNEVYLYREVSGNIKGADPLFINGGRASMGRASCNVYKLYEGSPAIGGGIYIEDGFHECPNDFFGNAIDKNSVNIGAYAGKGVNRDESTYIFDKKYYSMLDFENETVGAIGIGTNGTAMSGISRLTDCTNTNTAFITVTDDGDALNPATNSTKALKFKNSGDATQTVFATFYIYPYDLSNANGLRVYLNPNGKNQTFTFKMTVIVDNKETTYNESITTSQAGYRIITFNQKYDNSSNKRVDTEIMRTMRKLTISTSLGIEREVYIDDIQINNGEMDEEETAQNYINEEAETTLVEDFEAYAIKDTTTYGNCWSGSKGSPVAGIATAPNDTKAFFLTCAATTNTAYSGGFNYSKSFANLRAALAEDTAAEGIQFNLYTVLSGAGGAELTDDQLYSVQGSAGAYEIIFNGGSLTFTTVGGNSKTVTGFKKSGKTIQADKNGLVRTPFDSLYTEYTEDSVTYKKYLTEFTAEEQKTWKAGLASITFNVTTLGATAGCYVFQKFFMDNLSIYKNVKHVLSDWTVKSKPTCTTEGLEIIYCKTCNYTIQSRVIEPKNHIEGEWETLKQLTCTTDGSYQQKCTVCERIIGTKTITAEGHKYTQTTVSATCTEDGYTVDKCSCGDEQNKRNIVAATGHKETIWVVDKEATCTENGESHEVCLKCEETLQTAVELAGHRFKTTVVAPTCTEKGYTLHKCKNCDYNYKSDEVETSDHIPGKWELITAGNCENDGKLEQRCTVCDTLIDTKTAEATGHVYADIVVLPTCEDEGYTLHRCRVCKFEYISDKVSASNHTILEWKVVKKPTCTQAGEEIAVCAICKETAQTREIAPTGHKNYIKGFTAATYFKAGYTGDTYCSLCNQKLASGKAIAMLKLSKPKITKTLKGKKKVTVKYNKVTGATGYEISIKKGGKWVKYTTKKLKYTLKKLKKGTKYKVKVRAFVKQGTAIKYSAYSKAKSVKCK